MPDENKDEILIIAQYALLLSENSSKYKGLFL